VIVLSRFASDRPWTKYCQSDYEPSAMTIVCVGNPSKSAICHLPFAIRGRFTQHALLAIVPSVLLPSFHVIGWLVCSYSRTQWPFFSGVFTPPPFLLSSRSMRTTGLFVSLAPELTARTKCNSGGYQLSPVPGFTPAYLGNT